MSELLDAWDPKRNFFISSGEQTSLDLVCGSYSGTGVGRSYANFEGLAGVEELLLFKLPFEELLLCTLAAFSRGKGGPALALAPCTGT